MSEEADRVKLWNTFFKLTWEQAKALYETSTGRKSASTFDPLGGTLADEEFRTLASLLLCNLAIEARANHLINELEEQGTISKDLAEAARRLPAKQKWFLLPALANTSTTLDSENMPHQAISMICGHRTRLIHVKYKQLIENLPGPRDMLTLFDNFVKAMENMNVILGRQGKERNEVLEIGHFD